jgi:ubiquinone/menaquinone biosynthesis C-methylase UbiE
MDFTGERYVPLLKGDIELEHKHRYLVARELCHGKTVLDVACGEGFGSAMLAEVAAAVVGVDIASDVVLHAQSKYGCKNLSFLIASCTDLPLLDSSFDVVVSLETLEHLSQHDKMVGEIKRVLRPNGVLLISTPEKYRYSIVSGSTNPYHVKEIYRDEFERLLRAYFKRFSLYGQRVTFGSAILGSTETKLTTYRYEDYASANGLLDPVYLLGLASDFELPSLACGFFEQAIADSQLAQTLQQMIGDRDVKVGALEQALSSSAQETQDLRRQLAAAETKANTEITHLCNEIERRGLDLAHLAAEIAGRDRELARMQGQVNQLLDSKSWRMTAPLRALRRSVKRVTRVRLAYANRSNSPQRERSFLNAAMQWVRRNGKSKKL